MLRKQAAAHQFGKFLIHFSKLITFNCIRDISELRLSLIIIQKRKVKRIKHREKVTVNRSSNLCFIHKQHIQLLALEL